MSILDRISEYIIKNPLYSWEFLPKVLVELLWWQFLELDRWAYSRVDYFPLDVLKKIQKDRLDSLFQYACSNIKYWADLTGGYSKNDGAENVLKSLPPLTRDTLRTSDLSMFISKNIPGWRKESLKTSGTSSAPLSFFGDRLAFLRMEAILKSVLGFRANSRLLRLNLKFPPFKPLGEIFTFSLVTPVDIVAKDLIGVLRKTNSTHVFSTASSLLELALIFSSQKIPSAFRLATVVSEHLNDKDREFLENVFKCPIYNLYASREAAGPIAYECEERSGWHINMSSFLVEVLGPSLKEAEEKTVGEIVITMFDNRVMPFIRYQIGDRGYVDSSPCGCGRSSPRLFFSGRTPQFIKLKNGYSHPLISVVGLIRDNAPPLIQYQFEQRRPGEVVVKLVPLGTFTNADIENVLSAAKKRFRDELRLSIEVCHKIDGKNILFIDRLSG